MKITPLDITQKSFVRAVRGFDRQEVEAFLALVASEFEGLVKEVQALRDDARQRLARLLQRTAQWVQEQRVSETAAMMSENAAIDGIETRRTP